MAELRVEALTTHHVGPLSFAVGPGECLCIAGASGSGKSLLLRALADLDSHGGRVLLDSQPAGSMAAPEWRRQVVLVFAESQWWAPRVGEHFARPPGAAELAALGLPAEALAWEVARCSTGERQRLALLRALTRSPRALLLDEPTGNLDEAATLQVEALVARYRAAHQAPVIWVSHDPQQARRLGARRLRLEDGQLREAG